MRQYRRVAVLHRWALMTALTAVVLALLGSGCASNSAATHAVADLSDPAAIHREADGRRYRIERVPNIPGKTIWLDAETVRYLPLAIYKVAAHDEQFLYVKQYLSEAPAPVVPARPVPAAPVVLSVSKHFALSDFGHGLPHADQWRNNFDIADMNGDGQLDIVSSPARKSSSNPVIFLGDGHGNWQRWKGTTFPALPFDYGAAVAADFNGDGKTDIALGMHLRGLSVLYGDGHGHFSDGGQALPLGTPGAKKTATFSSTALVALDWNHDGRTDLVALSEGLLGPGKPGAPGGLTTFLNTTQGWSETGVAAIADAPRAGVLVRVATDAKRPAQLIAVSGTGGERTLVYGSSGGEWTATHLDTLPPGAIVRAVAAVAADAQPPVLAVAYQIVSGGVWHSAIDLYTPHGGGYQRRAVHDETGPLVIGALGFGHLSTPAAWDLVALRDDGALLSFAADGHGFFSRDLVAPAPDWRVGCAGSAVHLRDLDGDGIDEIVASFAGEPHAALLQHDCQQGGAIEAWKIVRPD